MFKLSKFFTFQAIVSYAELLESETKRDRQCASVALGFLGAKECIPQLTYLCAADLQADVRDAARHSLTSFGVCYLIFSISQNLKLSLHCASYV